MQRLHGCLWLLMRACGLCVVLCGSAALAATQSPPVSSLRVYVLDCGTIDVADVSEFSPGIDVGKHKTLAVSCYLVVHPKGSLLFDTGLGDALAAEPNGKAFEANYHLRLQRPLATQLQDIGHAPASIDYLALSHMHFDHIGNVGLFPQARLLMQKEEYDAAFGTQAARFGNDPRDYPTLAGNPRQLLSGDFDVFGDASVVLKRAIGHTPGHQVLALRFPRSGLVVLSGDLAHFSKNWQRRRVPGFNFDKVASRRAMRAIAAFVKAGKGQFWIGHDLEQNATIPHAPRYLD
ncbi:N-acyl homoserine lactonase family protein [Massilia sp. CF038]|uniref:N-acyl homoserine lactonase family protein n=1 Tax=Massilia sp. CF038 TaxID=1881045 RepID=UPI0009192362|nr:N-acyl homoserine lactonase family protein [Massilia sp. CF038]SHG37520.1 Glyoxylase, beta-lactamase superfamily II [Massilia sp. CF038]